MPSARQVLRAGLLTRYAHDHWPHQQIFMRQHMLDGGVRLAALHARQLLHQLPHIGHAAQNWQAMQTAPYAVLRALVQPKLERAAFLNRNLHQSQQPPGFRRSFQLAGFYGVEQRLALRMRLAQAGYRTARACRLAGQAYGCAQIHQTLRISYHAPVQRGGGFGGRQQRFGQSLQSAPAGAARQIGIAGKQPRHHALHIGIENGYALAKAEGGNGCGC